jgi:hypothetical protein
MKRMAVGVLLVLAAACGPQTQDLVVRDATIAANTARLSIETAETAAVTSYKGAQVAAVTKAKADGLTQEQAVERVKAVRAAWEPVWEAFADLRRAHALLVAAIEAYRSGAPVVREGERIAASMVEVAKRAAALTEANNAVAELLAKLRGPR